MRQIVALPPVKSALAAIQPDDELTLKEQIELNEIEAPPFKEQTRAADEENRRWGSKPEQQIKVELKLVGDRPAGAQTYESIVVDTARAALGTLGLEAKSIVASSTDSNLPISLGIPAATLGGGGQGSGSHSPGEWYHRSTRGRGRRSCS